MLAGFVGRAKDIIIRGGSNISHLEVGSMFRGHPAAAEEAVAGAPHPGWRETVRPHRH